LQEQADIVQTRLADEEMKSGKLLQQIAKLEEQVAVMSQESGRMDKVGLSLKKTNTFLHALGHTGKTQVT